MPRLKWPADLYPRTFWADDLLEVRRDELRRHVARSVHSVTPVRRSTPTPNSEPNLAERQQFAAPDFNDSAWPVIEAGQLMFEADDQLAWFRARLTVPEDLRGKTLALRFGEPVTAAGRWRGGNPVAEAMLFINGQPYHGVDSQHALILLPEELVRGGTFHLALHAWSGRRVWQQLRWHAPALIWFDADTDALAYDFDALYRTIQLLDASAVARAQLVRLGEDALKALDWTSPGSDRFYDSVREARAITQAGFERLKGTDGDKPTVTHIGHTHLDVAWLWTLNNIKEKTGRSWASALRLAEQYPEFAWIQSQPQLYKYTKRTYPEIWEQVKAAVKGRRWEADGGMWVEADCNVSGGESLVRQFLHGIRFFREELGVENTVLWLPDVFGYAWALPQIIKKSGLRYFMTTKIAWSQFNRFPYDTFRWRGIDGTEVLTHFITTTDPNRTPGNWTNTYNGQILPETVSGNWEVYQQKEVNQETLSSFGYGDGGGGPTREMMEFARRLADLPGVPKVRIGRVADFFQRLEERVGNDPQLPTWNGELYLEYHRGTYTSQAQQKRNNRKAEILLHNAELLGAAAASLAGATYAKEDLHEAWEHVLRNQFHDIIPGTSIPEVYADSAREYAKVFELGERALFDATHALAAQLDLPQEALVVFNPTGFTRSDLVEATLPEGLVPVDEDAQPLTVQDGLVFVPAVPANGWRAFPLVRTADLTTFDHAQGTPGAGTGALTVTPTHIETPFFVLDLNHSGQITRLYDTHNAREVLPPGALANALWAFEDKPLRWDAWDIDIFYQQKGCLVGDLQSATVQESGPERGVLRLVWKFEDSTITQDLIVYARTARIDFQTHVDWQQSQILLKAAFPVEIHSTRATYDVQFGNVERPTHWNTSWDWARFEVVGHKWADLSEGNYGVSLLNDCKYGYDIKDNVMRLTLIKSGTMPDPAADRGEHRFTYSLYPHTGNWAAGNTAEQGYRLNNPLLAVAEPAHRGPLSATASLVTSSAANVLVETVKQTEDGDGMVVRVYEYANARGPVELTFGFPLRSATETNLIEEDSQPVEHDAHTLRFAIKPYEIKTFVVHFA